VKLTGTEYERRKNKQSNRWTMSNAQHYDTYIFYSESGDWRSVGRVGLLTRAHKEVHFYLRALVYDH